MCTHTYVYLSHAHTHTRTQATEMHGQPCLLVARLRQTPQRPGEGNSELWTRVAMVRLWPNARPQTTCKRWWFPLIGPSPAAIGARVDLERWE